MTWSPSFSARDHATDAGFADRLQPGGSPDGAGASQLLGTRKDALLGSVAAVFLAHNCTWAGRSASQSSTSIWYWAPPLTVADPNAGLTAPAVPAQSL